MKTLIVFNQPAPYKVDLFNELSKMTPIDVIFERRTCTNRNKEFYAKNEYGFHAMFLKHGAIGEENSYSGEIVRYLKKHRNEYSLIVMNGYSTIAEIRAIRYLNRVKAKWVLMINGGLIKKCPNWKEKMKTRLISSAWKYVSPCQESDGYLIHYGARAEDISHFPNSTIYTRQVQAKVADKAEKDALRKQFGIPPEARVFVCPSQFIKRKNNLELVEAFKDRSDLLVLCGSGPEEENYRSFIKDNGMANVLIFGYLPKADTLKLFRASDFFVTLSSEDIYGHTTNEAMSQGLPVISTDKVVSSRHLVKNGINGYLIALHDKKALEEALDKIDSGMAEKALETARENTIEQMSGAICAIITELGK